MKRRYALVNDYGLRGAGMWALGYDGGRSELYRALADVVPRRASPPRPPASGLAATPGRRGVHRQVGGKDISRIVSYDVQVSANGGRGDVALGDEGDLGRVPRAARATATRSACGRSDSQGQRRARGTSRRRGAPRPSLGRRRVRRACVATASATAPGRHRARRGSARSKAGTIVAFTRGPVSADGFTWYEVTQPIREWTPVSFVERGVWIAVRKGSTPLVAPSRAPNSTTVEAGIRRPRLRGERRRDRARDRRPRRSRPARSRPNRDGSEDGLRLRWTNGGRMDSLEAARAAQRRQRSSGRGGPRPLGAGAPGVGRGTAWSAARASKDGRYLLQLVGTAGGPDVPRAVGATRDARTQVARYGVTRRHRARRRSPRPRRTSQVISPNGDGVRDTTRLELAASGGAVRWTATRRRTRAGTAVRTAAGPVRRSTFTWSGDRTTRGARVARRPLHGAARRCSTPRATGPSDGTLTVDTKAPGGRAGAPPRPPSRPNGDGRRHDACLSWTANEPATGTARGCKGHARPHLEGHRRRRAGR